MLNRRFLPPVAALAALLAGSPICFDAAGSTSILISVQDQKLALLRDGERIAEYRISSSRFGVGDKPRSYATPLGKLQIAERVGAGLPLGAVLKGRTATGEILSVNARGRDPIVTRILHLRGLQAQNENAFRRGIYIHGTPVERRLGTPDSFGCIRMRSKDVIALFDNAPVGTLVEIVDEPMNRVMNGMLASTKLPAVAEPPPSVTATRSEPNSVLPPAPEQRKIASNAIGGARLATAQDERRASERPQHMHFGMASITDLRSLGGIDQLRDAHERRASATPVW